MFQNSRLICLYSSQNPVLSIAEEYSFSYSNEGIAPDGRNPGDFFVDEGTSDPGTSTQHPFGSDEETTMPDSTAPGGNSTYESYELYYDGQSYNDTSEIDAEETMRPPPVNAPIGDTWVSHEHHFAEVGNPPIDSEQESSQSGGTHTYCEEYYDEKDAYYHYEYDTQDARKRIKLEGPCDTGGGKGKWSKKASKKSSKKTIR